MIDQFSSFQVIGASFSGLILLATAKICLDRYVANRQIEALGGRAPVMKTHWPLSLDYIYNIVRARKENDLLGCWTRKMADVGAIPGGYTAEVNLLFNTRNVITGNPENIKALLGPAQFADYGKGFRWQEGFEQFLGRSVFTVDGKPWHDLRQMMRPIFNRERVADLQVFEKHFQKLRAHLGPGDGSPVNIRQLFIRLSMDIGIEFLLDTDIDSLNFPDGELARTFDEVQARQALVLSLGPLNKLLPSGQFREKIKRLDRLVHPFIDRTLALDPAELESKFQNSETFLHQLARYTRDPKEIRDQVLTVLVATRDSTAATLSWIFYELSRRPDVVSKLRKEIIDRLGSNPDALPTYTDLKDMRYLNHVINETFRVYPVVPFNVRVALRNTTLPRGGGPDGQSPIGILKDTVIGFSTLMMQRRPDLYPPISAEFPYDPMDWEPDRWDHWIPKSWQFIPFSGGPRICMGQQFATVETAFIVTRIVQNFARMDAKIDVGTKVATQLRSMLVMTPVTDVIVGLYKD